MYGVPTLVCSRLAMFQVDEVARICAALSIGHIVNNAYGVQCSKTCRLVNRF